MKARLKRLSSRRHVQSVIPALNQIRVYMRGWLNYYGIAAMKKSMEELNGWLYHRIPYVYMEDVEAATVKDEVPDETGHTEEVRLHGGKQPKRVLVYFSNEHSKSGFIKRDTGTQRLL